MRAFHDTYGRLRQGQRQNRLNTVKRDIRWEILEYQYASIQARVVPWGYNECVNDSGPHPNEGLVRCTITGASKRPSPTVLEPKQYDRR